VGLILDPPAGRLRPGRTGEIASHGGRRRCYLLESRAISNRWPLGSVKYPGIAALCPGMASGRAVLRSGSFTAMREPGAVYRAALILLAVPSAPRVLFRLRLPGGSRHGPGIMRNVCVNARR